MLSHNHGIGKHLQKPQAVALKRGISECLRAVMLYIWSLVQQHICEFNLSFLNFNHH